MIRFALFLCAGIAAVFILVNVFLTDKKSYTKKTDIHPCLADLNSLSFTENDTLSYDYHFNKITRHFHQPSFEETAFGFKYRPDDHLKQYYRELSAIYNSPLKDLGHYGLTLIYFYLNVQDESHFHLMRVKNQSAPDIPNIAGYFAIKEGHYQLAEKYFRQELENKNNTKGAHIHLIELWQRTGRFDKIYEYSLQPDKKNYISASLLEETNFRLGNFKEYFLSSISINTNLWGFLAATLITIVWSIYLWQINLFKKHSWGLHIIFFSLGCIFTLSFASFLYDFFYAHLNFGLDGSILNDFFYCVFGIGAIEELIKIAPLLLFLLFVKIEDPIDYILFACASALGFAFIENLLKFKEGMTHMYDGRAFIAVISHLFDTSIIAYGLILAKFRYRKSQLLYFFPFYFLACFSHGFYDFWLLNETVRDFRLYTIAFMLFSMLILTSFVNNALNHSPWFRYDHTLPIENIKKYLLAGLITVTLFEYISNGFLYGPEEANNKLYGSIFFVGFFVLFLSGNLSNLDLTKGHWGRINIADFRSKLRYHKVIGKRIVIETGKMTQSITAFLPLSGIIVLKVKLTDEIDHLIIKLDDAIHMNGILHSHIIVRSKEENLLIGHHSNVPAYFLIKKSEEIDIFNVKDNQDLKLKDFVRINPLKIK